jgi:hypothetical protein
MYINVEMYDVQEMFLNLKGLLVEASYKEVDLNFPCGTEIKDYFALDVFQHVARLTRHLPWYINSVSRSFGFLILGPLATSRSLRI